LPFQEQFAKADLFGLLLAGSIVFFLWLAFAVISKYKHLFGQKNQNEPPHLGITHTGFEISLGKLRVAGFRRSAKLPVESINLLLGEKKP
jgi:hypothetical protein